MPAFEECLRAYRDWARSHPYMYRLLFGGRAEQGAVMSLDDETLRPLRRHLAHLADTDLLLEGTDEGRLLSVWGSLHGHILLELALGPLHGEGSDHFAEHERGLLRGLLTDAALETA